MDQASDLTRMTPVQIRTRFSAFFFAKSLPTSEFFQKSCLYHPVKLNDAGLGAPAAANDMKKADINSEFKPCCSLNKRTDLNYQASLDKPRTKLLGTELLS